MSGDWIKMRFDLQTHPKVVRIASALKADRLRVVGGLHAVWCVFDAHSIDGQLTGYTPEAMDDVIHWPGFTQAMIAVNWASVAGSEVLVVPRFDEHNGRSAKRRAMETERKINSRRADNGPLPVQKMSASDADKMRTREEKRREEEAKRVSSTASDEPAGTTVGITPSLDLGSPDSPPSPPVMVLPALQGKRFDVYPEYITRLQGQFPGVPVEHELRQMQAWLEASPRNGKTLTGIPRFVVNWLSREQDKTNNGARSSKPAIDVASNWASKGNGDAQH